MRDCAANLLFYGVKLPPSQFRLDQPGLTQRLLAQPNSGLPTRGRIFHSESRELRVSHAKKYPVTWHVALQYPRAPRRNLAGWAMSIDDLSLLRALAARPITSVALAIPFEERDRVGISGALSERGN